MALAQETQSDEPLTTAHMLLGLVSHIQDGDFTAAADHYAQTVVLAWGYHVVTGQWINKAILRHLEELAQRGKIKEVQAICAHILHDDRQHPGNDFPDALQVFELFLENVSLQ